MGSRAAAPLGVGTLGGGAALPLPLYIVEAKGQPNTRFNLPVGAALPLSLLVSRSAWRSPVGVLPLHYHHAVVLLDLHQPLLPPCWIKKEETSR